MSLAGTPGTPQIESHRRDERSSWTATDWRAWFDERAGILEYEAGLPRAEAEARAFVALAVEWTPAHPDVDELRSGEAEALAEAGLAALGIMRPVAAFEADPPASESRDS